MTCLDRLRSAYAPRRLGAALRRCALLLKIVALSAAVDVLGARRAEAITDVHRRLRSVRAGVRDDLARLDGPAALVVAAGVLIAGLILGWINPDPAALTRFTPEHVSLIEMADSRVQLAAYQAAIAVFVLGALTLAVFYRRAGAVQNSGLVTAVVTLGLAATALWWLHYVPLGVLIGIVVVLGLSALSSVRIGGALLVAIGIIVFALLAVPGLIAAPQPQPAILPSMDMHYAGMFLQGLQLAAGRLLFIDMPMSYGILWPTLAAMLWRAGVSLSMLDLVRFVQVMQVVCLASFVVAAILVTRGAPTNRRLVAIVLVLATAAPWLGTTHLAVWFPVQSGARFLMYPVAVVAARFLPGLGASAAGVLTGAVAALALLINAETGIAITAAMGLCWLLRVRRGGLWPALLSMALGPIAFAAVFIGFGVAYRASFGAWPLPSSLESASEMLGLFASGYGGLSLKKDFDPFAILIMAHAGYVFVRALRSLFDRTSAPPAIARVATATMILVFFPYYFNRPLPWDLWTFIVLYALLLAPLIASTNKRLLALVVMALIVLPASISFPTYSLKPLRDGEWLAHRGAACADGLESSEAVCTRLRARAAVLKQAVAEGSVLWSTSLPLLTARMSGLNSPLWTSDLFSITRTPRLFDDLTARIKAMQPRSLLIDSPRDDLFAFAPQVWGFNQRLVDALGTYCAAGVAGGWEIFHPQAGCAASAATPEQR